MLPVWKMLPAGGIISILLLLHGMQGSNGCQRESFGADSFVCVCSTDYCDDFPEVVIEKGFFKQIASSKLSHRFEEFGGPFSDEPLPGNTIITINLTETYQTMHGFGGAFTDATGINIADLSMEMQEKLLRSYFSTAGIEYTIGRIPIAGSDFSTRPYSYDDVKGDLLLENFALAPEDYLYKLPYITWAQDMSERPLLFFGSPWAPPSWMKETGMFNGTGGIKPEMWQPWANYFVKFVESYESKGVSMWGLTPQNGPVIQWTESRWNSCEWNATSMRDWIKTTLGPTLEAAGLRRLQLMVLDHVRKFLPSYPATILDDPDAYQYVDGIGVHWYSDFKTPPELMDAMHNLYPEKFLLYTESCIESQVTLGAWGSAERYGRNIIEDINHWSTGWVDWNMVLDLEGGPNWAYNFVDAPIIVNKDENKFYKQPMFYVMGHFSKYVTTGDVRVSFSIAPSTGTNAEAIKMTSFLRKNGQVVVVIMNTQEEEHSISILDTQGSVINLKLDPHSFNTILYEPLDQGISSFASYTHSPINLTPNMEL